LNLEVRVLKRQVLLFVVPLALCLGGCRDDDTRDAAQDTTPDAATQPAPDGGSAPGMTGQGDMDMRIEVDLDARQLHVVRAGQRVESHPVAVGSSEWPTPTGEWQIGQVIFNPRWVPPNEEWARDEETKEPGDPENPLGRAQLVYQAPNSIHGTNEPESLGQAVSHGSIRVSNDVAVRLARQVMEAGGAARDESWFRQAEQNRTQRQEVSIPNPVPIRVSGQAGRTGG
jgi:lipoprotein-anchoring transpeptidase ErfK/SrfK